MKSPLISVIVPVYNVENYVRRCLDSIVRQTYDNLEVILVDDESTDNSGSICDEYANTYSNFSVIHKKNGGLSEARNTGLQCINGQYVTFVDSDDWLEDDMYQYLFEVLCQNNADVAVCGHFIATDNEVIASTHNNGEIKKYTTQEAVELVVKDELINSFAWDKLYKRELFTGITYPSGRYVQDIFTTYRVFMKAQTVVVANVAKYFYYKRSNSIQGSRGEKLNWDQFCVYEEQSKLLEKEYFEISQFAKFKMVQFGIAAYNCYFTRKENSKLEKEHQEYMYSKITENIDTVMKMRDTSFRFKVRMSLFKLRKLYEFFYVLLAGSYKRNSII